MKRDGKVLMGILILVECLFFWFMLKLLYLKKIIKIMVCFLKRRLVEVLCNISLICYEVLNICFFLFLGI